MTNKTKEEKTLEDMRFLARMDLSNALKAVREQENYLSLDELAEIIKEVLYAEELIILSKKLVTKQKPLDKVLGYAILIRDI